MLLFITSEKVSLVTASHGTSNIMGQYVPKPQSVYKACQGGGLRINSDPLGFFIAHLNLSTRPFLDFDNEAATVRIEPATLSNT